MFEIKKGINISIANVQLFCKLLLLLSIIINVLTFFLNTWYFILQWNISEILFYSHIVQSYIQAQQTWSFQNNCKIAQNHAALIRYSYSDAHCRRND